MSYTNNFHGQPGIWCEECEVSIADDEEHPIVITAKKCRHNEKYHNTTN